MSNLTQRNIDILKIIIEEFILSWNVIWSKSLLKKYDLWVSSATIRNDMAFLEKLELIYQPYSSAWRLPTTKWLRVFINYLMNDTPNFFLETEKNLKINNYNLKTLEDFIFNIIFELSKKTKEICFFVSEEDSILEYNWISNYIEKDLEESKNIIKMFEYKYDFIKFISNLPLNAWVNVFIWEENFIKILQKNTLIVRQIKIEWKIWYIWIIWWLQMNYSFNISAIKWII